jgi:hypothetical protein
MGHSYGGFMTANLLAYCDLFKAGIARKRAHNRTLTPFGLQNEDRRYLQNISIFLRVQDQDANPVDSLRGRQNTGTFPIASRNSLISIRTPGAGRLMALVLNEPV